MLTEADLPYLDVTGQDFLDDATSALRAVRAKGRFAQSRRGVEVLAHDDVLALLTDSRLRTQDAAHYQGYGAGKLLVSFATEGLLASMQEEKHRRIRRVFLAGFKPRLVEAQHDSMRVAAEGLVAALPDSGSADFVQAFSSPFPMRVLCDMLGIPSDDIPQFTAAATQLHLLAQSPLAPGFPAIELALQELWDYCIGLVELRRAQPENDTISSLIRVQDEEGRLSDEELVWNIANLIFAGQDTTRYQLASAVRAVVQTPGMWQRMQADPDLVPSVAEETLRYYPVVNFVVRIPTEDLVYDGIEMRAGRRVILNFQAASRDPERFIDPDRFTPRAVGRHPQSFDLPFGLGAHFCLGAALARLELQQALAVLVERLDDVAVGQAHITQPAGMLYGPETLPITYTKR